MNRYWQQKKAMAPGCEPAAVRNMMEALRPIALGQSLAGAGGGGFLFVLTRDGQQGETVRLMLDSTQVKESHRVGQSEESGVQILDKMLSQICAIAIKSRVVLQVLGGCHL